MKRKDYFNHVESILKDRTGLLLKFCPHLHIINFIPSKTVDIVVFIFSQAVETMPHIVLSITEKKAEIEFQISEKKFLTDVHTSLQLVPNKPKNTSAMPLSVSRIPLKKFFIKSHIPVNISFIPFYT